MCLAGDIRLAQMLQWRVDGETLPFRPGLGGQFRQMGKASDEFGPAIGIARIIERIHPDEDIAGAQRLGPGL